MAAPKPKTSTLNDAVKALTGMRAGDNLTGAQIASMLNAVGGPGTLDPKMPKVQGLLAAISRKTPDEWQQWFQSNQLADTPASAAPAAQKPASTTAPAKPAAKMSADDMRKRLVELEMPEDVVRNMSDADLAENLSQLESAIESRAKPSDGRGEGKTGRRNRTALDRAKELDAQVEAGQGKGAAAPQKPAGKGKRGGAGVVSTEGEKPASNIDKNTVDGGAKDLAALPSGDLYKMAREAQIREGMTPNARVTPTLDGSGVVDVSPDELNKVLESAATTAASVDPFPQSVTVATKTYPAGTPHSLLPPPQGLFVASPGGSPPGGSPPGGSPLGGSPPGGSPPGGPPGNTPSFFIYPEWWSKQTNKPDTSQDGPLKSFARRPHFFLPTAAVATGIGYSMYGGQGQPADMDAKLKKALEDEQWLQQRFNRAPAPVMPQVNPADAAATSEDTIRRLQGAK